MEVDPKQTVAKKRETSKDILVFFQGKIIPTHPTPPDQQLFAFFQLIHIESESNF